MWPFKRCKHPKRRRIWRTTWKKPGKDLLTGALVWKSMIGHACICPDCGKVWWERKEA